MSQFSKRKGRGEEDKDGDSRMSAGDSRKKNTAKKNSPPKNDQLKYEDAFEDEEEEEDIVMEGDEDKIMEDDENKKTETQHQQLFRQGIDKVGEEEGMEYDNSAYAMLHRMNAEWPCLSFDFIRDSLGTNRTRFPHTSYMIAGSQASDAKSNKIFLYKMADMYRTKTDREHDDGEDSDDSDDDNFDDDAIVTHRSVKHTGAVNRIRTMPQQPGIVASWSDTGRVYFWNFSTQLKGLGYSGPASQEEIQTAAAESMGEIRPFYAFKDHRDEGYALDWSPVDSGRLASGDCYKYIHTYKLTQSGSVAVDGNSLQGHSSSVEDIQWSPTEATVLSSCSVDGTVKIWDTRKPHNAMLSIEAHETDVNVISWNKSVAYLLASGADDGSFKIWDLRMIKPNANPEPVGHFTWHQKPITSLEWHPTDESVIAVSGDDNQVSVWDLALEEDIEVGNSHPKLKNEVFGSSGEKIDIPAQLLFLHQGQEQPKEIHFHPQIPGLIGSTAADGFHMFICEPLDPKNAIAKEISN